MEEVQMTFINKISSFFKRKRLSELSQKDEKYLVVVECGSNDRHGKGLSIIKYSSFVEAPNIETACLWACHEDRGNYYSRQPDYKVAVDVKKIS